jgi:hypothetical protein
VGDSRVKFIHQDGLERIVEVFLDESYDSAKLTRQERCLGRSLRSNVGEIEPLLEDTFTREMICRKRKEIFNPKMKKKYEGREYVIGTSEDLISRGYFLSKKEMAREMQQKFEEDDKRKIMEHGFGEKDEKEREKVREWERYCESKRLKSIEYEKWRKENPPSDEEWDENEGNLYEMKSRDIRRFDPVSQCGSESEPSGEGYCQNADLGREEDDSREAVPHPGVSEEKEKTTSESEESEEDRKK